jgi:hypothetical protein
MNHSLRARARASWRPLVLIFLLVLLAGTTFTFVKVTFADKLERVKSELKFSKVRFIAVLPTICQLLSF